MKPSRYSARKRKGAIILLLVGALSHPLASQTQRVDSIMRSLKRVSTDSARIELLLKLCTNSTLRDAREGVVFGNHAVRIAEKLRQPWYLARAHIAMGKALAARGERRSAEDHLTKGLSDAEKSNMPVQTIQALLGLSDIARHTAKYPKAASLYNRALRLSIELNDSFLIGETRQGLGYVLFFQGQFNRAREEWESFLTIAEDRKDSSQIAAAAGTLALLHARFNRDDKAWELISRAIAIRKALGHKEALATLLYNGAAIEWQRGRYEQSMALYRQTIVISGELRDTTGLAEEYRCLGDCYAELKQSEKAEEMYARSVHLSESIRDTITLGGTLNQLAILQRRSGNTGKSTATFQRMRALMEARGDLQGTALALINIGSNNENTGRYDEAIDSYERCLAIHEKIGTKEGIARVLSYIGNVYLKQNRYDAARRVLERSLALREELGLPEDIAVTLNTLSSLHRDQGRYDLAMEQLERALHLAEESSNTGLIATQLNAIGILYRHQNQYAKALEYYDRCLRLRESIGDTRDMADVLRNMAIAQTMAGNLEAALLLHNRSLELAESFGDKSLINGLQAGMGNIRFKQKRYEEALEWYHRYLEGSRELGEKDRISLALLNIVKVRMAMGQIDSAYVAALYATRIAREIGNVERMRDGYLQLSMIAAEKGDFPSAYEHHLAYTTMQDSLLNEKSIRTVNELSAKYENEKKEQQITILEQEKSLKTAELEARQRELALQLLTTAHHRQRALLFARLSDVRRLELVQQTAELELRTKDRDLQRVEKEKKARELTIISKEKERDAAVAGNVRNALIAGLIFLGGMGFLGFKRVRAKRIEASLRAETAEYKERVAKTEILLAQAEAEQLRRKAQEEFSRQLIESQEVERTRLATELHDQLGQDLVFIRNSMLVALQEGDGNDALSEAAATAGLMLENVRRLARDLHPYQLDRYGLTNALIAMVNRLEQSCPTRFQTEIDPLDGLFDKNGEINVYRIVQEGVNNIVRHAEAEEATVRVVRSADVVELVVEDNGKGFGEGQVYDFGLHGMGKRVELLGGKMRVESKRLEGTKILITLPVSAASRSFTREFPRE